MKKPGYYYKRVEKGNSNVAWTKAVLRKDGKDIVSVTASDTRKGLHVSPDNKQLLLDGVKIAEASDPSLVDFSADKFGDIPINTGAKVINITLADYNRLRSGDVPKGYRRYDPKAVYNIVEDVAAAGELYVDDLDENVAEDRILANMLDTLPDNELKTAQEKLDYGRNTYTFISPTNGTPHLSVYNTTAVIEPGGAIEFDYMVDTRNMAGLNLCQFGQTFTVIVEDMFGRELFRRTTYAGIFHCRIEGIKDEGGSDNFVGEGWWSIRAIDGNHVDSVTHYFDFLSKEEEAENFYEPSASDLATWGIRAYDSNDATTASAVQGWRNKYGLSKLMAWAAAPAQGYNGLRLPTGIYYIDYHKNVATGFRWSNDFSASAPVDLGQHKYYLIHIYTDGDGVKCWNQNQDQEIYNGGSVTIDSDPISVNTDPMTWILGDGAELYRDATTSTKVKVGWYGEQLGINEVHVENAYDCLRMSLYPRLIKDDKWKKVKDGWYYMVKSTMPYVDKQGWSGGDPIIFPDNFTLDLNGSTLKGVQCYDIRTNASLLTLNGNIDTHVINGKIEGIFNGFDFRRSSLFIGARFGNILESDDADANQDDTPNDEGVIKRRATGGGPVGEGINNIGFDRCRYCSFENIESSYSMGYDGKDVSGDSSKQRLKMKELGYFDFDCELRGTYNPTPLSMVPSGSSDYRSGGDAGINLARTIRMTCSGNDLIVIPYKAYHYACGKQHEIFVHWFTEGSDVLHPFKTVKTQMYHIVKKPAGATRFIVSGYALTHLSNGLRVLTMQNEDHAKAWEQIWYFSMSDRGRHNMFKDCYWHHTRTCALTACQSKGIVFDHCRWDHIAIAEACWKITAMLGDLEEGWQLRDLITIKGCQALKTSGMSAIQINTARNLLFTGNTGFVFKDCGGVESAWVHDNELRELRIHRRYYYDRPCVYFRNNKILRYGDNGSYDTCQFAYSSSLNKLYEPGGLRCNRCDDPINNVVSIVDSIGPAAADKKGVVLSLQRSKIGTDYND